jgi:alpha-tubulin suppressor-like RCC1 family protein
LNGSLFCKQPFRLKGPAEFNSFKIILFSRIFSLGVTLLLLVLDNTLEGHTMVKNRKSRSVTEIYPFIVALLVFNLLFSSCSGGGGSSEASTPSGLTPEQIEQIDNASKNISDVIQSIGDASDPTILEKAKAGALEQSAVESAQIIDGQLVVKYKDAGVEVWVINPPLNNLLDDAAVLEDASINAETCKLASISTLTKAPAGTNQAVLINPLSEDLIFSEIIDNFSQIKTTLEQKGYKVTEYNGTNASLYNLRNLSQNSIIIMAGHGGPSRDKPSLGQYGVQTGQEWDKNAKDSAEWKEGIYFKMDIYWGKGCEVRQKTIKSYYAITGKFWEKYYSSSHFNNALFMACSCESYKDPSYRNALINVGISAYTGYDNSDDYSPRVAKNMISLMANGKTFKEAGDALPENYKTRIATNICEHKSVTANFCYGPDSGYSLTLGSNISGMVLYNGEGVASVPLTLSWYNDGKEMSCSVWTDSYGKYTFPVFANGTYTVIPRRSYKYSFDPPNRIVILNGSDITGEDFNVSTPLFAKAFPTNLSTSYHTVFLKSDGTLWAWGRNEYGELGDGNIGQDQLSPEKIGTSTDWVSISAGLYHTVAIKSGGTLWAWGSNYYGQLGVDSSREGRYSPVQIGNENNWVAVSAGSLHTMAIKSDGTLWAWGDNSHGQLGDSGIATSFQTTPEQIGTDTHWAFVSAGDLHNIAIKTDGTIWVWGNNFYGQLGDGTQTSQTYPKQICIGTKWIAISAGMSHTMAIKTDGTLWAWGSNYYGQLGDGNINTIIMTTPEQIGKDTSWIAVSAGAAHTMAIKINGTLWGWGYNNCGQLGDGSTTSSYSPVQIGFDTDWFEVVTGPSHTLALKTYGTLWAWGAYEFGALGDGGATTAYRTIPEQIGIIW